MSTPSIHRGDHVFQGHVQVGSIDLPANNVTNAHIAAAAGIEASKLQHPVHETYSQKSTATAVAERYVAHVVSGTAATVVRIEAGCVTACIGDAEVTVDLLKNGVSILSAAITLDSGQSARDTVVGAISSASLVAADVLEIDVTVAAGTGTLGVGAFAKLQVHESA